MTERSVTHATFCIERTYEAPPARVFAAFADPVAKAKWFKGPDEWAREQIEFDFRVGGREKVASRPPGGPAHIFDCVYRDIVPDQRIVYTYDMYADETNTSVSVTTIELKPAGTGTRLIFTEQGAFLDGGASPAEREAGTRHGLIENLAAALAAEAASV
jgi:uncharacterized protein YndB with AHSA1/START domain